MKRQVSTFYYSKKLFFLKIPHIFLDLPYTLKLNKQLKLNEE